MLRATAGTRFDPRHLPYDILGIILGYLRIVRDGMRITAEQNEPKYTILGVIDGRVIKYCRQYLSNDCELVLGDVVVAVPDGYMCCSLQGRYVAWDFPKFIRYYDVTGAIVFERPRTIDCRKPSYCCLGSQRIQHYTDAQIARYHIEMLPRNLHIPGPCMHDDCTRRMGQIAVCRGCEAAPPLLPAEYLGNVDGIDYYRTVRSNDPMWWHSILVAVHPDGGRIYVVPLGHSYPPTVAHGLVTTYHRTPPNLRCIFHDPCDLSPIGDFTYLDNGCGIPLLDSGTAYYIGGNGHTLATLE